jgi:multidrug efflux pump subunit AcrB
MSLIASITGVVMRGMDNNILTQVGFIVLICLAAKNAILIVEFAAQLEQQGKTKFEAATEAARLRMRPILMTSLAFILGVVPLVWAIGAGAELRQALGTAVFAGMIGVTFFGLIFTPVFYVTCRWLGDRFSRRRQEPAPDGARAPG